MINLNIPADPSTSGSFLLNSLGSFWNQIFSESGTIKGYTIGMAQELIQLYQNLIETVYSYGVSDVPVYHKEVWQPITVLKSQFNQSPFLFEPTGAVFGPQPSTDPFYANQTFQFGFPKSTTQFVYSIDPSVEIGSLSLLANNVYTPSNYYISGVDVQLQDGILYFNTNPFDNPLNTIIDVIGTNGVPSTYVDKNGVTQNDQMLILWSYNIELDQNNIYNNFGYIFNINLPSSEEYKNILKGFFNIASGGANVLAIKSILCYIGGIVPVIEKQETVQYVATNEYNHVVVTNKHSYLFDLTDSILPTVVPGAVFYAGDTFTNLFSYYDSVIQKNWWVNLFANNSVVPFSSYLFLGSYQYQLLFPNSLQLITLSPSGVLHFPVEGAAADVQTFQNYINEPTNKTQIIAALGLGQTSNPITSALSYPINPLNFIFENFLQNNSAIFVLNFSSVEQTTMFLSLFNEVKKYLPKHVYFILSITVNVGTDVFDELNNSITFSAYPSELFNADGSNQQGNIPNSAPYYYNNVKQRLFSLTISPVNSGQGLLQPYNIQHVRGNSFYGYSGVCSMRDAKVFTTIPTGATTATVKTLRIINFA